MHSKACPICSDWFRPRGRGVSAARLQLRNFYVAGTLSERIQNQPNNIAKGRGGAHLLRLFSFCNLIKSSVRQHRLYGCRPQRETIRMSCPRRKSLTFGKHPRSSVLTSTSNPRGRRAGKSLAACSGRACAGSNSPLGATRTFSMSGRSSRRLRGKRLCLQDDVQVGPREFPTVRSIARPNEIREYVPDVRPVSTVLSVREPPKEGLRRSTNIQVGYLRRILRKHH